MVDIVIADSLGADDQNQLRNAFTALQFGDAEDRYQAMQGVNDRLGWYLSEPNISPDGVSYLISATALNINLIEGHVDQSYPLNDLQLAQISETTAKAFERFEHTAQNNPDLIETALNESGAAQPVVSMRNSIENLAQLDQGSNLAILNVLSSLIQALTSQINFEPVVVELESTPGTAPEFVTELNEIQAAPEQTAAPAAVTSEQPAPEAAAASIVSEPAPADDIESIDTTPAAPAPAESSVETVILPEVASFINAPSVETTELPKQVVQPIIPKSVTDADRTALENGNELAIRSRITEIQTALKDGALSDQNVGFLIGAYAHYVSNDPNSDMTAALASDIHDLYASADILDLVIPTTDILNSYVDDPDFDRIDALVISAVESVQANGAAAPQTASQNPTPIADEPQQENTAPAFTNDTPVTPATPSFVSEPDQDAPIQTIPSSPPPAPAANEAQPIAGAPEELDIADPAQAQQQTSFVIQGFEIPDFNELRDGEAYFGDPISNDRGVINNVIAEVREATNDPTAFQDLENRNVPGMYMLDSEAAESAYMQVIVDRGRGLTSEAEKQAVLNDAAVAFLTTIQNDPNALQLDRGQSRAVDAANSSINAVLQTNLTASQDRLTFNEAIQGSGVDTSALNDAIVGLYAYGEGLSDAMKGQRSTLSAASTEAIQAGEFDENFIGLAANLTAADAYFSAGAQNTVFNTLKIVKNAIDADASDMSSIIADAATRINEITDALPPISNEAASAPVAPQDRSVVTGPVDMPEPPTTPTEPPQEPEVPVYRVEDLQQKVETLMDGQSLIQPESGRGNPGLANLGPGELSSFSNEAQNAGGSGVGFSFTSDEIMAADHRSDLILGNPERLLDLFTYQDDLGLETFDPQRFTDTLDIFDIDVSDPRLVDAINEYDGDQYAVIKTQALEHIAENNAPAPQEPMMPPGQPPGNAPDAPAEPVNPPTRPEARPEEPVPPQGPNDPLEPSDPEQPPANPPRLSDTFNIVHDWLELGDGEGWKNEDKFTAEGDTSDQQLLLDVIRDFREHTGQENAFETLKLKLQGGTFVQDEDSVAVLSHIAGKIGTLTNEDEYFAMAGEALTMLESGLSDNAALSSVVVDTDGVDNVKTVEDGVKEAAVDAYKAGSQAAGIALPGHRT